MSTSANRPVVFDLGSAYIKCGFAGEASPRYVLASPLGELRAREPPLEPSQWAMELGALFSTLFFRRLQTRPKDRQVLVCEPGAGGAGSAEAAGLREGIATALLEQLHVASVCIAPCGPLALLPSGFTTGVALDVGWREARVTAVYDGLLLRHAARSVAGGAARVQLALRRRLAAAAAAAAAATEEGGEGGEEGEGEGGLPLPPPTEAELEDMVVRACFVLPRAEAAAAAAAAAAALWRMSTWRNC
jgi:actin-related protein 10